MRSEISQIIHQLSLDDPALTQLDLKHQRLSKDESLAILKALENNTQVVELIYLDNDSGSDEVSIAFGNMLKGNQSIHTIYLGTNNLGNAALAHIIEGIMHHPMLTMLDLNSNPFDDEQPIVQLVSENTPLQEIDLTDTKISSAGFLKIKNALENNSHLTTFNVYCPPLSCLDDIQSICQENAIRMRLVF